MNKTHFIRRALLLSFLSLTDLILPHPKWRLSKGRHRKVLLHENMSPSDQ